ncbi:TetR/AcrR family transcriptional regulator [Acetanaerobacterium elongatum]|uniref:Transcriptional regulator, TetR family n=1 Tax=Acetanaerobacterium elongatum TaxID=258515 RepID=A0A1H0G412_9FIRM|nr:TetR/AcrR family transcriptional regulator [Acetanaerobacterium elongatum]SDO01627.1 transcriptional regulator, TetR family [Acetanaerobacterium elongatum]
MSLVKEQREQIRTGIIETAVELFKQKGYEQVSVDDITRTVGVAKGTFYNYFQAKSDILLIWIERLIRQVDCFALISPQDTAAQNLHRVVGALLKCAGREPELFKSALREVISLYSGGHKTGMPDIKPVLKRVLEQSSDIKGEDDGRLALKVNILKNALYMEMLNWYYCGKESSGLKERLNDTVDICLYGILHQDEGV